MDISLDLFPGEDEFSILNTNLPLSEKLITLHRVIAQHFDFIERIAVALYEPETGYLKTFLSSDRDGVSPITAYRKPLRESTSLSQIARSRRPRALNDLDQVLAGSPIEQKVKRHGFVASYTVPMYHQEDLSGFVFFNSTRKHVFFGHTVHHLNMLSHLISLMVMNDLTLIGTLAATIRTATGFVRSRDFETGAHLERMASYARMIAMTLAKSHSLSDEFIEHLFLFAPLHDIGKMAIPDRVLLKPGKLDDDELAVMRTHTTKGAEIVDTMVANMKMGNFSSISILRNLVEYHHEVLDGSGYPKGLTGDQIPIEARIVAVADIFDALTSERPYKRAWTNEEAFAELTRQSGLRLDASCVEAVVGNVKEILRIQKTFVETPL